MTKPIEILIDGSEQTVPEYDETLYCKDHPKYKPEQGFGLAGGGYGIYTYCTICCKILSKKQEDY